VKNREKSINFMFSPGGGSGPKHSAFCGACFSINSYKWLLDQKRRKSGQKNHEPSVFFKRPKSTQKVKNRQKSIKFHKWGLAVF
jgi:hypothetical protein